MKRIADENTVLAAAATLVSKGIYPSCANVLEHIGGGSKTTVLKHLKEYHKRNPGIKERLSGTLTDDIPAHFVPLVRKTFNMMLADVETYYATGRQKELENELEATQEELRVSNETVIKLEARDAAQQSEIDALKKSVALLEKLYAQLESQQKVVGKGN